MREWKRGFLVLEDGSAFSGEVWGTEPKAGEVVFNTSHSGYEEIATDPSYHHQILVATATQQGNYGVDRRTWQSDRMWIRGFIALDIQDSPREGSWLDLLREHDVPAMRFVDTRRLVTSLRDRGSQWGAIVFGSSEEESVREAISLIRVARKVESEDWTMAATCSSLHEIKGRRPDGPRVAVLDFGCKENIVEHVVRRSSLVFRAPANTSSEVLESLELNGLILSNGPGDPERVGQALETIGHFLGRVPIFGICMGHQVLGRALGGKTFKLKFGHRGGNHPVKDVVRNKIYITSQNHGYALDPQSLPEGVEVTHVNLNDGTVSGLRSLRHRCWGVQFHPENAPGPRDAEEIFDHFFEEL